MSIVIWGAGAIGDGPSHGRAAHGRTRPVSARAFSRDQNTPNHRYPYVTPTPHDALFRAAFAHPERAAGLLRHIFPRQLVDAICWDSFASAQGVFVDRKLDPHATDLLFGCRPHRDARVRDLGCA